MFAPLTTSYSELKSVDFLEAQPWCNFVLFSPEHLPDGMEIVDKQLRTESDKGFSSYRFLITDNQRTLSVKQFLYDWAPPAYDHPSLWRDAKISKINETPIPKPFLVGQDIAWIGLNFKRQRAASLNLKRTMIEMTVIQGDFDDEELIQIYRDLRPVSEQFMNTILETPFACLSKAYRHKEKASPVPLSYWKHTRNASCSFKPIVPNSALPAPINLPQKYAFGLNSIFFIGKQPIETEYYYEKQDLPGSYIRLLVREENSNQPLVYPPILGDQACHGQIIHTKGIDIHHAYLTKEFGPHELIWSYKGMTMLLLIKPASWTSLSWCHQFVSDLVT